jgi:hypothetical protein
MGRLVRGMAKFLAEVETYYDTVIPGYAYSAFKICAAAHR